MCALDEQAMRQQGVVVTSKLETQTDEPTTDNHDQLTHIIRKEDHYKGYVLGQEVEALCGKQWVPFRDPELFEVCEACVKIYDRLVQV